MHNVRTSRFLTRRSIGRSREIHCEVRKNDDAEWLDETDVDLQQSTVPATDLQDAYAVVSVGENPANPCRPRAEVAAAPAAGRVSVD
ncbi:hypothetical protein EVAR_76450_1 [Eumeta japonica]|uniref:Uncharacterized protein n=1 Tax=Eumeta variegata TaxID=151549 RepID=A0A4C1TAP2_EUMVA|nr:hypothetical protein EVAR_76450_1 [Eumeta japonica]